MYKYYPLMIGIVDQLNKWNEDINKWADEHMGNVGFGVIVFFGLLGIAFFGVERLNRKNR